MEGSKMKGEIDWEALKKDGGGIEYIAAVLGAAAVVVAVGFSAKPVMEQKREEYGAECWDAKNDAAALRRKLDSLDRGFLAEPREGMNTPEARKAYSEKRSALDREYVDKAMLWRKCIENKQRNSPNVAVRPKTVPRARSQL